MDKFRCIDPCTMLSPVPAVMVSCCGTEEKARPNIITVAWAGTVNSQPPMVSISVRKQRFSHKMIMDSGEFVINLVDADHCRELDWCGVKSGRDFDKFTEMKLTPIPVEGLKYAPAIAECPGYIACRVHSVETLGSHDVIIGEVVGVALQEKLFNDDGSLHLERAGLVCYNHGVYQRAADVLGFFGYSLARPDVLKKRMKQYDK